MLKITLFSHYIPALVKSAFLHLFHISETASVWDLKTALLVTLIRATFTDPKPGTLLASQEASLKESRLTIPICLLKDELTLPADNNVKDIAFAAIRSLGNGTETFSDPTLKSVKVEWVGNLRNRTVAKKNISEREQYSNLMKHVQRDITILYLHGGQFWRMGRAPREITHHLAKETGGRCFAVQYRLSPQNPFPAALLDGLAAYLCLLYPPKGSLHTAVNARNICFAGDSAGGNLVLALTQLILEIRRQNGFEGIMWQGCKRELPLPAGISSLSPYNDMTRALDSEESLTYDIVPPAGPPFLGYDPCMIWPASPPRHHVYADDDALVHPLVSPVTAEDWSGAPPTWICVGEECLAEQGLFVAQNMYSDNVPVVVEQYTAMPHNFPLLMDSLASSTKCKAQWASFIRAIINNPASIEACAMKWSSDARITTGMKINNLVSIPMKVLTENMHSQIEKWGAPPS